MRGQPRAAEAPFTPKLTVNWELRTRGTNQPLPFGHVTPLSGYGRERFRKRYTHDWPNLHDASTALSAYGRMELVKRVRPDHSISLGRRASRPLRLLALRKCHVAGPSGPASRRPEAGVRLGLPAAPRRWTADGAVETNPKLRECHVTFGRGAATQGRIVT